MNQFAWVRHTAGAILYGLGSVLVPEIASALTGGTDANRLTYLDTVDPYYVSHTFPKLTTPMWVGEEKVECVILLSIDDLRDTQQYELFLGPTLGRLKQIDGRSPLSIFTCAINPADPQLQRWLRDGLSLEVHTVDHPCPIFSGGDLSKIRRNVHDCLDQLATVPNCRSIALRTPCCDVLNSNSPRVYTELIEQPTSEGNFLTVSSSVHNIFTKADPLLPIEIAVDERGHDRYLKFIKGNVPILGKVGYQYVNYVENYPYPFVVGPMIWEIPCHAPGDHQANFYERHYGRRTVVEWEKGIDAAVLKKGLVTLLFHPYGKISPEELIEVINYATTKYGQRVTFLNMHDVQERLDRNLLAGHPLRAADGTDNGVRLLDINNDGYLDVVIGNEQAQRTRLWSSDEHQWEELQFPARIDPGVRFGVLDAEGLPTAIVQNERVASAWRFDGKHWVEDKRRLTGLRVNDQPVLTSKEGRDRGVRLRDIDGNGLCELIVGNPWQNAVFAWSNETNRWNRLPYSLPSGTRIVDGEGRDAGLRFADVNGDGRDDLIFSDEAHYSVHEFVSPQGGWSRQTLSGKDRTDRAIPTFVLDGRNNGAFFHSGQLWVVNELTNKLPNHAFSIDFSRLSKPSPPPRSSCPAERCNH